MKRRKINHSFVRIAPDQPTEAMHSAFRTEGTLLGEMHVIAFRYRRTAIVNGAELPGKLMLVPPPLTCYRHSSSL